MVGDILILSPGIEICADGLVVEGKNIVVDESILTSYYTLILDDRIFVSKQTPMDCYSHLEKIQF